MRRSPQQVQVKDIEGGDRRWHRKMIPPSIFGRSTGTPVFRRIFYNFHESPITLFVFSWGDCSSEHSSDTGFGQLSTISRLLFPDFEFE